MILPWLFVYARHLNIWHMNLSHAPLPMYMPEITRSCARSLEFIGEVEPVDSFPTIPLGRPEGDRGGGDPPAEHERTPPSAGFFRITH